MRARPTVDLLIALLAVAGVGVASVVTDRSAAHDRAALAAQKRATAVVIQTATDDHQQMLRRVTELEGELAAARRSNADLTGRLAKRASRSRRPAPVAVAVAAADVAPAVTGVLHDITEYCDTGSTTASGKWPQPGMVAVMDRSIPFGTRVVIDGIGTFVVEDWIGHGSEFDIFTHSCSAADRFGRQHRAVQVLR